MNKKDIESTLSKIITNFTEFNMKEANRSTSLREDIGLSSFDIIALITDIEEAFAISIDDFEKVADLTTFGEAVDLIAGLLDAGS